MNWYGLVGLAFVALSTLVAGAVLWLVMVLFIASFG